MVEIRISELAHEFEDRLVFDRIDLDFGGDCLAVTGPNGSGKSTLLRIIAGLLTPTSGAADVVINDKTIPRHSLRDVVGMAAPGVRLYSELSVAENLRFLATARGLSPAHERLEQVLDQMHLRHRADDVVGTLSSGLRQRACLAAAVLHDPVVLLLDEPSSNLDEDGISSLRALIDAHRKRGMVIIATNDASEAALGSKRLQLGGRQ